MGEEAGSPPAGEKNKIYIASYTPYFLKEDVLWFSQHYEKMKEAAKHIAWWKSNFLVLRTGDRADRTQLMQKLTEMGYERKEKKLLPGEYSVSGETMRIFPINELVPFRVGFYGNAVETIAPDATETISEEMRKQLFAPEIKKSEADDIRFLRPGDFVAHKDHGIGVFSGFQIVEEKKYYIINYAAPKGEKAKPDQLLVPEEYEKRLTPYFGFTRPSVHRLGSLAWEHTKKRVREDVLKTARELIALYAQREIARRAPFEKDDALQRSFEQSFEFIETADQLRAIAEIKHDLEQHVPMDRIVVGDVGFGKTEVAMRAAFKVASQGFQVALLCPTTILADQHFLTFRNRLGAFPLTVALLSRFEPAQKQKETLQKLRTGEIDILIGTHRILSQDVVFKKLGLLIVDEEQRFGVKQKEKLKRFHASVDVLSLSATPIPRSLYMSLSNLRDMSIIATPPPNRQAIDTTIIPYDKALLKEGIEQEVARDGQIYFLHNRIQTIEKTRKEILDIAPDIKIGIAHSRIGEQNLRRVMREFREKKFDLLLATTIIENGLDLENVNTLIVENAANLGLSQAYQIRGRIGRSDKKAKAILFYREQNLSEKGKLRLEALQEAQALGSGYFIAKKDLEIRGAGNLLGKEQSGNINKVGFNIYCQMLAEATEQLK